MKVDDRTRQIRPAAPTPQRPQPWDYRTARMERDAELDQFASEGWELVAVMPDSFDPIMAYFYFRRRRG